MKGFIILILGIIAVIIIGGAVVGHQFLTESGDESTSEAIDQIFDKVSNVESQNSGSSEESVVDKVSDIVSEEVKFNYQNGEGYYREVTYSDGGFRQYDTETGDLIGSSYESDQDKLPSME